MSARKIVQITSCGVENTIGTQCNMFVHALCDDGSVVEYHPTYGWIDLPPLPEPPRLPVDEEGRTSD